MSECTIVPILSLRAYRLFLTRITVHGEHFLLQLDRQYLK